MAVKIGIHREEKELMDPGLRHYRPGKMFAIVMAYSSSYRRRPVSIYLPETFRWTPFFNGVTAVENCRAAGFPQTIVDLRWMTFLFLL